MRLQVRNAHPCKATLVMGAMHAGSLLLGDHSAQISTEIPYNANHEPA